MIDTYLSSSETFLMQSKSHGRVPLIFDINLLQREISDLCARIPFAPHSNQLSLKHREQSAQPFYDGVGSLYDYNTQEFTDGEESFNCFNKELKGTYLEEVYLKVEAYSPFGIGRVRIMNLHPKTCLSLHCDPDLRFHIPIVTNPACFFVFLDEAPIYLPADGSLYWLDTRKPHTVFNGSRAGVRTHLVFSTHVDSQYKYDLAIEKKLKFEEKPKAGLGRGLRDFLFNR